MRWLGPPGSDTEFPPIETALDWPNGLLAAGGDLSPERLLMAYRRGIFPWYETGQPILWWCPDPRTVIFPGALHVARRLRRYLAQGAFEGSFDRAFSRVVRGCARAHEPGAGTWITPAMMTAYDRLHALGHAHSVEIWQGETLAGGLYGVAVGRVFFAESMFSRAPNASRAAMVLLDQALQAGGFRLMDCQLPSPHLFRMGAVEISRAAFLELLAAHTGQVPAEGFGWCPDKRPVSAPRPDASVAQKADLMQRD